MTSPGRLLASGRDADIFECGPGLVLRRSRHARSMEAEAATMEYLRRHDYPVPAVDSLSDDGTDLIMERIDGPSMVEWIITRPWHVRQAGAILARLHDQLHAIPAPPSLPPAPFGHGDQLLHMDFHPLNVIMRRRGPVVIDWPNASRGEPNADIAICWMLMSAGEVPGGRIQRSVARIGRQLAVNGFTRQLDLDSVRPLLAQMVEWKVADPNMSDGEKQAMWQFAEDNASRR